MFEIKIPTVIDFSDIPKSFIKANASAITSAAATATTPVRAAMPVKTGRMASQVGIRFFKQKNGLLAASVKVLGDRYHVSAILENGSKYVKARHSFERVFQTIEGQIGSVYTDAFFQALE